MGPGRLRLTAILVFCLVATASARGQASGVRARIDRLRAAGRERVIILYESDYAPEVSAQSDVRLIRRLRALDGEVCEVPRGRIEQLRRRPGIRDVVIDEPVEMLPPTRSAPAALLGGDGLLSCTGAVPLRWNHLQKGINAKAAWDRYGLDGSGLKIAFVDSGVNYTLADTDLNYLGGIDYVGDDNDPFTNNALEYHGTMIVSAAVGEGQSRVTGIAPNGGYYVARVTDENFVALVSDIVAAVDWAMDPDGDPQTNDGADIINMSLGTYGGGANWTQLRKQWEALCQQAYDRGIVVLAASGNDGRSYSTYPAAFVSVISVGAHDENQRVWNNTINASNGGADVVSPGAGIIGVQANGVPAIGDGTSFAAPHASALVAMQKQYARANGLAVNTAYLWEALTHSAVSLGYDPLWQGSGKTYAASTGPADANDGAIDLMAAGWPITCDSRFNNAAFIYQGLPVYRPGDTLDQDLILTNITDLMGNPLETAQNLLVSAVQFGDPGGSDLPGASSTWPAIAALTAGPANSATLSLSWTIPADVSATTAATRVRRQFKFLGGTRTLDISGTAAESQWRIALLGDLNVDGRVDFRDLAVAVAHWGRDDCASANNCNGADIDTNGSVNAADLQSLAANWLAGVD